MNFDKWTLGLAALGVVSLASAARADEKMSQLQAALSNTTLSGYVGTAAQWNPGTDANAHGGPNLPLSSFANNDGFTLNAIDLALDHPEDESPWAVGYHVEFMLGPDATPGPGIRLAYLSLRTPVGNNGIDWKIGVFDAIIGYESNSDPQNPNYTRSYGYTIEPATGTGVLGTYKFNDEITVQAGVADGAAYGTTFVAFGPASINGTSPVESQKAYMGAVTLTAPASWGWASGATLNAGLVDSEDEIGGPVGTTSYYLGVTVPTPASALKTGASFDYLDGHDGLGEVWVGGLYGSYQLNPNTLINVRGEYGQDDTGLLYGAFDTVGGGARNAFEEFTATLQYNLWANVLSRLEFRWDHVEHGAVFGANAAGHAFRNNDFMLAANLVYQF